jgi:hypothetical protein
MEYPKINTLFERNEDFSIDPTRLKHPVYWTIKEWDVTEKVDGTNIRVIYDPGRTATGPEVDCWDQQLGIEPSVRFAGRTDAANTPGDLLQNLAKLFPVEKFTAQFQAPVVLYGEGYGAGIQKVGKFYRPDKSFILFDVLVDGKWWLDTKAVQEVAKSLECDVVPYYGRFTLDQIIDMVRTGKKSCLGDLEQEGIVARPLETLFDSRHERVILKLKTKDFVAGKR